jgi:hypothetical protein
MSFIEGVSRFDIWPTEFVFCTDEGGPNPEAQIIWTSVEKRSINSSCVDAGSDTAENLDMNTLTTRTDQIIDSSIVNMGYHYLYRP